MCCVQAHIYVSIPTGTSCIVFIFLKQGVTSCQVGTHLLLGGPNFLFALLSKQSVKHFATVLLEHGGGKMALQVHEFIDKRVAMGMPAWILSL